MEVELKVREQKESDIPVLLGLARRVQSATFCGERHISFGLRREGELHGRGNAEIIKLIEGRKEDIFKKVPLKSKGPGYYTDGKKIGGQWTTSPQNNVVALSNRDIVGFMSYWIGSTLYDDPYQLDLIIPDPNLPRLEQHRIYNRLFTYYEDQSRYF
jgi:hypothetical protein